VTECHSSKDNEVDFDEIRTLDTIGLGQNVHIIPGITSDSSNETSHPYNKFAFNLYWDLDWVKLDELLSCYKRRTMVSFPLCLHDESQESQYVCNK
jgi:hypothetical protein